MLEETLSGDLFSLMKIDFQLTELEVVNVCWKFVMQKGYKYLNDCICVNI